MEKVEFVKLLTGFGVLGITGFYFFKWADRIFKAYIRNKENESENLEINRQILDTLKDNNRIFKSNEVILNNLRELTEKTNNNVLELDRRYQISTLQITESIYDEKMIGNDMFRDFSDALNSKASNRNVVKVMEEIDENGLDDENRLNMLKENIVAIVTKGYDDMKKDILRTPYSKEKLDNFEHSFNILFSNFKQDLKELIEPVTYTDLKYDINYTIFKQKIKNLINQFSSDLSGMIKNIVKKY